jgi:hypothetical protein
VNPDAYRAAAMQAAVREYDRLRALEQAPGGSSLDSAAAVALDAADDLAGLVEEWLSTFVSADLEQAAADLARDAEARRGR